MKRKAVVPVIVCPFCNIHIWLKDKSKKKDIEAALTRHVLSDHPRQAGADD